MGLNLEDSPTVQFMVENKVREQKYEIAKVMLEDGCEKEKILKWTKISEEEFEWEVEKASILKEMEEKGLELYEKEVNSYNGAEIEVEHDYIVRRKTYTLDIFIYIKELGSLHFVKYKFNKENLNIEERKEHIVGPNSSKTLLGVLHQ